MRFSTQFLSFSCLFSWSLTYHLPLISCLLVSFGCFINGTTHLLISDQSNSGQHPRPGKRRPHFIQKFPCKQKFLIQEQGSSLKQSSITRTRPQKLVSPTLTAKRSDQSQILYNKLLETHLSQNSGPKGSARPYPYVLNDTGQSCQKSTEQW